MEKYHSKLSSHPTTYEEKNPAQKSFTSPTKGPTNPAKKFLETFNLRTFRKINNFLEKISKIFKLRF